MPRWVILLCALALLGIGFISLGAPNLRLIGVMGFVLGALGLLRALIAFVRGTPNA
jgi:hypothetical protein